MTEDCNPTVHKIISSCDDPPAPQHTTTTTTSAGPAASQVPPPFWDPASAGSMLPPSSSSSTSDAASWQPSVETAARIIKANAFGDDYEDLASAAARGVGGKSVVGLWPGFSYFNHSCMPSTVHYVVGDAMVVRAVQDIAAGGHAWRVGGWAGGRWPSHWRAFWLAAGWGKYLL